MQGLSVGHGNLCLGSLASSCSVEAEDACGEDAELQEDHSCSSGNDHWPGGADHLSLRVVSLNKDAKVLLTPWVPEAVDFCARVNDDFLGKLAVPGDNLLAKILVKNKSACVRFRHFCCGSHCS